MVPGLKTRRLDRLSAWALVASSLAIKDAGIDLSQVDRSRVAVVFATSFGCVELTEAFYQSAAANGWSGTDPSTFPETLANAPASHVALFHDLRGPNITVGSKGFAGESALIQAASLLRHGQADLAIVLAGDTLTRAVYEWYEAADLLSPACYNSESLPVADGFVPSEGVTALVLEAAGRCEVRSEAHSYARFRSGCWAAGGQPVEIARQMLGGCVPSLTICAGNGAPCATSPTIGLGSRDCRPERRHRPAAGRCCGSGRYGRSSPLDPGLKQSAQQRAGSVVRNIVRNSGDSGFAALLLELP